VLLLLLLHECKCPACQEAHLSRHQPSPVRRAQVPGGAAAPGSRQTQDVIAGL
jgi:hypothetical protein